MYKDKARGRSRVEFINLINKRDIKLEKVKSCACGNEDFVRVSYEDRFALPFGTKVCRRCGLVVTDPRISEESLTRYYKEIYFPLVVGGAGGDIIQDLVSDDQPEKIYRKAGHIISGLGIKGADICEIGCASGSNLTGFARLAARGGVKCRLYGSEYEDKYAATAADKGITMVSGGVEDVARHGEKFDLIILSHVFEHMIDLKGALKAIRSALKEGGALYIEVPGILNGEMMQKWYGGDYSVYCVHAHMYNFNLASLNHILAGGGFGLIDGDESVSALYRYDGRLAPETGAPGNCRMVVDHIEAMKAASRGCGLKGARRLVRKLLQQAYFNVCQPKIDAQGVL